MQQNKDIIQLQQNEAIIQYLTGIRPSAEFDINVVSHGEHGDTLLLKVIRNFFDTDFLDYLLKIQLVEFLIKNGADIEVVDNKGYNGLHIFFSELPIWYYIYDRRELLPYYDTDGSRMAENNRMAENLHIKFLRLLIESGFDIHRKTNDTSSSPLHLYIERFLSEHNIDVGEWDGLIDWNAFVTILQLFIDQGFDLDLVNGNSETILLILVKNISQVNYETHVERNEDYEEEETEGTGYRHWAEDDVWGYEIFDKFIKILIDKGASLDMRDKDGNTALHYAFIQRKYDIARKLLDSGASFIVKNNKGLTPLDLFIEDPENKWLSKDTKGFRKMVARLALSKEFEKSLPESETKKLPRDVVTSILKHIKGGGREGVKPYLSSRKRRSSRRRSSRKRRSTSRSRSRRHRRRRRTDLSASEIDEILARGEKCKKQSTKKYSTRKSPPYPANKCHFDSKRGNDGKMWRSLPNKNGVFRWVSLSRRRSRRR